MASRPVAVRILHPHPGPGAGPLERWVAEARTALADHHRTRFLEAGAADVAIVGGPPDDTTFGARIRDIVGTERPAGLVVLGSGAIPLADRRDYRELVATAAVDARVALTNNRYSADVVALGCAEALMDLPELPADNALPRWLAEVAGFTVRDLRRRWRLGFDIDGPLDLVLLGLSEAAPTNLTAVRERIDAVRSVAADRRAELVMAGRVSAAALTWLERGAAARVRAIVEERGLRAASRLAQSPEPHGERDVSGSHRAVRAPASVLGAVLDREGPGALGEVLGRLGDAAIVDTRVLLAHRLGAEEIAWPGPEDRFASDLLLPDRIRDPWLRELTASALRASMPILLGGHSLVGPGTRLVVGRGRTPPMPWS